jgi:hypothetical protein
MSICFLNHVLNGVGHAHSVRASRDDAEVIGLLGAPYSGLQ